MCESCLSSTEHAASAQCAAAEAHLEASPCSASRNLKLLKLLVASPFPSSHGRVSAFTRPRQSVPSLAPWCHLARALICQVVQVQAEVGKGAYIAQPEPSRKRRFAPTPPTPRKRCYGDLLIDGRIVSHIDPVKELSPVCRHLPSLEILSHSKPYSNRKRSPRGLLLLQARSEPHAVFFASTLRVSTDVGSKPRQVSSMTTDLCRRLELVMTSELNSQHHLKIQNIVLVRCAALHKSEVFACPCQRTQKSCVGVSLSDCLPFFYAFIL